MRVIVFTKFPRPGLVKTRLARSIGFDHAAALQAAFLRDELDMLAGLNAAVTLCCDPVVPLREYMDLLGRGFCYTEQCGADLGQRMICTMNAALEDGPALLIGSDLPDLPRTSIAEAWEMLDHASVCLGPTPDGGFHLLGLRRPLPQEVFAGVRWGAPDVLARSLGNFSALGIGPRLLPSWPDVDTHMDLLDYARRNQDSSAHTMVYIREHNLVQNFGISS
ncbi:MAG: glycosyltransferase [Desulfovibrionales bacterium]|nr:glycosyltransferase [Desulfovibrionales bacterium]